MTAVFRDSVPIGRFRPSHALDSINITVYVRVMLGGRASSHQGRLGTFVWGNQFMAKSASRGERPRLTRSQQELVRRNVGLVAVHLRRHMGGLSVPRRDREYEDLFQEGCLGLVRAAARWEESGGIPFPAYALPRIHNAISMAIKSKFLTVYVPPRRPDHRDPVAEGIHSNVGSSHPKERSLSDGHMLSLQAASSGGNRRAEGETIGDRVRDKYAHAVRLALASLQGGASKRGDRDELLKVLANERLLVPNEESRRPLRQIARETRSSYARVAQCSSQLTDKVKSLLDQDPELAELLRRVHANEEGLASPIDSRIECALVEAGAREYARRFESAGDRDRSTMFYSLFARTPADMRDLVRRRFREMSKEDRERLLRASAYRDDAQGASPRQLPVAKLPIRKMQLAQ